MEGIQKRIKTKFFVLHLCLLWSNSINLRASVTLSPNIHTILLKSHRNHPISPLSPSKNAQQVYDHLLPFLIRTHFLLYEK